jgi:hypothetical protein
MTIYDLFKSIQSTHFSHLVGSQNHLFGAAAQLLHITGLILVLSSIVLISLRLLNVGTRTIPLPELAKSTFWLFWGGMALLTVSGIFIFAPAATNYAPNYFFWSKFILLAIALLIHVTLYRKITATNEPNPVIAKITAVMVLTLWFGVAFSARFIGFA